MDSVTKHLRDWLVGEENELARLEVTRADKVAALAELDQHIAKKQARIVELQCAISTLTASPEVDQ